MAWPNVLSIAEFQDKLEIANVIWDSERYDEYYGIGSGHDIQSQLAKPKWKASVVTTLNQHDAMKRVNAVLRKMNGISTAFMLYDPLSPFPQSDPTGSILGSNTVTIKSVGADNESLALAGLPVGYTITVGDKGQVVYGSTPERNYFFEFSQTGFANASGETPEIQVFPYLPVGVQAGATVILKKPACKMVLYRGQFTVGNSGQTDPTITDGTRFQTIEKL